MNLNEAQIQALIAMGELAEAHTLATGATLEQCKGYFHRAALDWTDALASLIGMGLLAHDTESYHLTSAGAQLAAQLRRDRPRMWYFYNDYYRATASSKAYSAFCERVFGRNFAQHGFSDMAQLDKLLEVGSLGPANRVLDLGCGNGAMAEYIAAVTGAHVTGIDYIPEAITQAQQRAHNNSRLAFSVMNMDALTFAPGSFDTLVSIDTLYFVELEPMIWRMQDLLSAGGQMLIFYAHGIGGSGLTPASFPRETLAPDKTPLGVALAHVCLRFRSWDFTRADYEHARLKKQVIEELRTDLEAEGNAFLYQNRLAEANGAIAAFNAAAHARYLYQVLTP